MKMPVSLLSADQMRVNVRIGLLAALFLPALGLAAAAQQAAGGASSGVAGAPPKNPIATDAKSIAEGRQAFAKYCSACHGPSAKGDGKGGALLKPRPADLTDDTWIYGATDGEIFTTIRNGVPQTGMRGFAGRMTTRETWTIVNFLRTLRFPRGREG